MKRVLCIWLPNWPIQRLVVARPELKGTMLVLHARDPRRGQCVVACSRRARRIGVRVGMPLAEVTALTDRWTAASQRPASQRPASTSSRSPQVSDGSSADRSSGGSFSNAPPTNTVYVLPHDAEADRQTLERLALWCEQFSPLVGLDDVQAAEGLLLDVTGVGRLFAGEPVLARRVAQSLRRRGYWAQIALADTIGVAWALAHFGSYKSTTIHAERTAQEIETAVPAASGLATFPQPQVIAIGQSQAALAPLPIQALRLSPLAVEWLRRLGVERIEQLMDLPRDELAARLGQEVLQRLDQALGVCPELVIAYRAPTVFRTEWILEHATVRQRVLVQVIEHLSHHLAGLLQAQKQGALEVRCQLKSVSQPLDIDVGLFRPTANGEHLFQLLRMQLETQQLPGPVNCVQLLALSTAPLPRDQQELWDHRSRDQPRLLADLIDRLSSRLGTSAVTAARLRAHALPEEAYVTIPLAGPESSRARLNAASGRRSPLPPGQRPLWLFPSPQPIEVVSVAPDGPPIWFHCLGQKQLVDRHWGPERIETSWWRGPCVRRDYYHVECTSGFRFWLFRRLDTQTWFLQG